MSADANWPLALKRFGHGARPVDKARSGDPREALIAEISKPDAALLDAPGLLSTSDNQKLVFADQAEKKRLRDLGAAQLARSALPSYLPIKTPVAPVLAGGVAGAAPAMAGNMMTAPNAMAGGAMMPAVNAATAPGAMAAAKASEAPEGRAYRSEALARLAKAVGADIGFAERWVAFWSNHFCVSISKSNLVHVAAGSFEREAIRAHAFGRFADMLRAVEQHPAMLHFLDNQQSIGPDSPAGRRRKVGLNENLAREILELHTMGVGSGYGQTDVTSLARVITGWTSVGPDGKMGVPGTFVFNVNAHEPGAQTILDKSYAQAGEAQGEAALDDIAHYPATARHIANKLAKAFVSDDPQPQLAAKLAAVFQATGGDLLALAKALIEAPEAWSAPATKLRNPWEWTVASYRAFDKVPTDPGQALNALRLLGQPLWQPAGPNGFSDDTAAWLSPEGIKTRVEVAALFSRQIKDARRPADLVDPILGAAASSDTRETIARAETPEQAYALLILSPEFMRR